MGDHKFRHLYSYGKGGKYITLRLMVGNKTKHVRNVARTPQTASKKLSGLFPDEYLRGITMPTGKEAQKRSILDMDRMPFGQYRDVQIDRIPIDFKYRFTRYFRPKTDVDEQVRSRFDLDVEEYEKQLSYRGII